MGNEWNYESWVTDYGAWILGKLRLLEAELRKLERAALAQQGEAKEEKRG